MLGFYKNINKVKGENKMEEEEQKQEENEETQNGPENVQILIVTDKGFAMKTTLSEFRIGRRKTTGVQAIKLKKDAEDPEAIDRGNVIAVKQVQPGQLIFVATKNGVGALINTDVVRLTGRKKAGVTLMRLSEGDSIVSVD